MSYKIIPTRRFVKELKRLVKKHPSLKNEYARLIEVLEENPTTGTQLGSNCYEIRLAIASKGVGKSGGARVICHVVFTDETVYLLAIYDKSEQENITDKNIIERLKLEGL